MTVVFLTPASGSPWSKPGNWTDAGHTVELVGCGATGSTGPTGANANGSTGGSAGAYYGLSNPSGSLGATTPFAIKAANTIGAGLDTNATYWEGTTTTNTYQAECGDNPGTAQAVGTTNGTPSPVTYGTAVSNIGGHGRSTSGANTFPGGGGGGGAAGPSGSGNPAGSGALVASGGGTGGGGSNGGSSTAGTVQSSTNGTAGGQGNSGSGSGAGSTSASSPNGSAGSTGGGGGGGKGGVVVAGNTLSGYAGGDLGNATDWVQTSDSATAGAGGGGGGGGGTSSNVTVTSTGGAGANYGGGGGAGGPCRGTASTRTGGDGGDGLIVIIYTAGTAQYTQSCTVTSAQLITEIDRVGKRVSFSSMPLISLGKRRPRSVTFSAAELLSTIRIKAAPKSVNFVQAESFAGSSRLKISVRSILTSIAQSLSLTVTPSGGPPPTQAFIQSTRYIENISMVASALLLLYLAFNLLS